MLDSHLYLDKYWDPLPHWDEASALGGRAAYLSVTMVPTLANRSCSFTLCFGRWTDVQVRNQKTCPIFCEWWCFGKNWKSKHIECSSPTLAQCLHLELCELKTISILAVLWVVTSVPAGPRGLGWVYAVLPLSRASLAVLTQWRWSVQPKLSFHGLVSTSERFYLFFFNTNIPSLPSFLIFSLSSFPFYSFSLGTKTSPLTRVEKHMVSTCDAHERISEPYVFK